MRAVALGAALLVVVAGCGALDDDPAATRPVASGSPTITHTPSGDMLRIDGELVRAVLIPDPSHGALYALTDTALYHYERGHWEPTGAGNDGRWLLLDPSEPDRILRGDHPPCDGEGSGEPIPFDLSEDAGRRWRVLYQGVNIRPLAFDGSLPGVVYGSDCGLAISSSRGVKWERLRPFAGHDVVALAATGERLYVIGVSSAGVSQLRAINVTDPDQPVVGEPLLEIPGQATLDTQGDRIVVGAVDAVYLSDDAGVTWASSRIGLEQVTTPPTPAPVRPPRGGEGEEYGIQVVRIQPGNLHRIYAGAPHGLYVSQDDGVTWVRYTQVNFNASVIDIQFALDGADLYVTTTAGVIVVPAP
ncbi:MAG TPA: hypothetical protein VMM78_03930 [Thermomicrobiales bacterium]|nr:hypothetical protein [Thermomicrobiales bacterium]